jgi:signal transduction histidine kinase
MAKGFVEQSGGDLDIQTEQGVGTTVSLWMPMSLDPGNMSHS